MAARSPPEHGAGMPAPDLAQAMRTYVQIATAPAGIDGLAPSAGRRGGRELYRALHAVYNPAGWPRVLLAEPEPAATPRAGTPRTAPPAPQVSEARRQIEELYGAHNPSKLAEVSKLCDKYGETRLLEMVSAKYGSGAVGPIAEVAKGLWVPTALPTALSDLSVLLTD